MVAPLRAAMIAVAWSVAAPAAAQTVLTLDDAITRAVAASPQTGVADARRAVLSAARAVADTRPVGSIDLMAENFGAGGPDLNQQIQVGATYVRPIERAGKRAARIGVVEADQGLADAETVVRRLEIATAVQRLYVEVQASEAAIGIARERIAIAEAMVREVGRRVAEARDPLFAGSRARAGLAEAKVDLEIAEHAREAALGRLAALWGGAPGSVEVTRIDFLDVRETEGAGEPAAADVAIFRARGQRSAATVRLAQANARPDRTVSVGPRYIGTGDIAVVAGLTLPFANRHLNRATIAHAEAEGRQVEAELAQTLFERRQQIGHAAERVNETAHEAQLIRERVIPTAQRALAEVRAGFARGGFTYNDVAEAQLALYAARERMVRAATLHHEALIDYDRLTGRFAPLVEDIR